jgi:hypothetical protein
LKVRFLLLNVCLGNLFVPTKKLSGNKDYEIKEPKMQSTTFRNVESPIRKTTLLTVVLVTLLTLLATTSFSQDPPRSDLSGTILDKPYLLGETGRVSVGGYLDMEFEWNEGGSSTFDQHRFIPFITGHVSDRVTVSAEIEFEHGGQVGTDSGDGEIKLEYAVMDFQLSSAFAFRGGVILSPLGSFNLLHDSPLNDLTARPVVSRQLVPSTLSESGMGFFGDSALGEEGALSYQAYFVNGFNEDIINGDGQLRVRGGRGSQKKDNNQDKALTARLGYSPTLGTNLGFSIHTGKYDNNDEHRLTISAFDAKVVFGPLEFQGELAAVSADMDQTVNPDTAEKQFGGYAQANYHILHDSLLKGSVVTLVVRGDWVDYDTESNGDAEEGATFGVNFRPTEETVFKFDYNLSKTTPVLGEKEDALGRFFFSFATYF